MLTHHPGRRGVLDPRPVFRQLHLAHPAEQFHVDDLAPALGIEQLTVVPRHVGNHRHTGQHPDEIVRPAILEGERSDHFARPRSQLGDLQFAR